MGREYGTMERLLLAANGYVQYIVRFFAPIGLSAFYPYPADNTIPGYYYLTLVIALVIVAIPMVLAVRKHKDADRLLWSIGLYSLMIALVLQFITIGNSTMNDRYTYVAYIGLCFGLASYIGDAIARVKYKTLALSGSLCFIIILAVTAYGRASVWQNSETLWRDVISKYPIEENGKTNLNVKTAYKNLADHYASRQEFDSAFAYYKTIAITGLPDAEVWSNMGNIYVLRNDMHNALKAFNSSLDIDAKNYDTWFKRGLVYMYLKQPEKVVADMDKVLQLKPDHKEAAAFKQQFSNAMHQ
jgi:tetratricopeptide (TPR) repeat protein